MNNETRRYPGVRQFETREARLFFGRDRDIRDLYELICLEKVLVLFGKSGYGKSSLLNAGLIPKIQQEKITVVDESGEEQQASYYPIVIRMGSFMAKSNTALKTPIDKTLYELETRQDASSQTAFLDEVYKKYHWSKSLWYHFKRRQGPNPVNIILIFDQFEEFFSYPTAQQLSFREELADLLYTRVPQFLRDEFKNLTPEQKNELIRPMDVKAVFAIRSDRIAYLDTMKVELPSILHKRYELKALGREQAREAIVQPAGLPQNDFISKTFTYTPQAQEIILNELSQTDQSAREGIESFQLQILCQYIEGQIIEGCIEDRDGDGTPDVFPEDLPDIANIYEQYYNQLIDKIHPDCKRAAQILIEEKVLYEDPVSKENRRLSIDGRILMQQPNVDLALLNQLVDSFLLRREPNSMGDYNYEISHDTLVSPILKAKKERLEQEALLAQEAQQKEEEQRRKKEIEDLIAQQEKERTEREKAEALARRLRIRLIISRITMITSFLLLATTYWWYKDASDKELKLQKSLDKERLQNDTINYQLQKINDAALEKDSTDYLNLVERGASFEKTKDYNFAAEMYRQAIETTNTGKGDRAELTKKITFAEAQYQKVLQFNELIKAGDLAGADKNWLLAIRKYDEAYRLNIDRETAEFKKREIKGILYAGFLKDIERATIFLEKGKDCEWTRRTITQNIMPSWPYISDMTTEKEKQTLEQLKISCPN